MIPQDQLALWRPRAAVLATNVANGSREHREIAHTAALIRQDHYDCFVVELLQDAIDQALKGDVRDSTVVIARTECLLAVSNGGQAVTARDIERSESAFIRTVLRGRASGDARRWSGEETVL